MRTFASLVSLALASFAALAAAPVNTSCPLTGEPVKDGVTAEHAGQTVGFCCPGCAKKFQAMTDDKKAATLASLNAPEGKPAPVNTVCVACDQPVSADSLVVHAGDWDVAVCCAMCEAKWNNMTEHDRAVVLAKFAPAWPVNADCPIGKEPIVWSIPTFLYEGHGVGICCPGCEVEFLAKPKAERDAMLANWLDKPVANTICPIGLDPVLDDSPTIVFAGQKIAFCCDHCVTTWKAMSNESRKKAVAALETIEAEAGSAAH